MPVDGGEPRQLLPPGKGGHIVFSPDGRRLAIARGHNDANPPRSTIAIANPDGSDHRVILEHTPMSSESDWLPYQRPQWTPDGQQLLLVSPGAEPDLGDWAALDGPATLLKLQLDGSTEVIAEAGHGSMPWRNDYQAYWSPDGKWVAFLAPVAAASPAPTTGAYPAGAAAAPQPTLHELVIAATDGPARQKHVVGFPEIGRFAWSPSGNRFVAQDWTRDAMGAVHTTAWFLGGVDGQIGSVPGSQSWTNATWLSADKLLVTTAEGVDLYPVSDRLDVGDAVPVLRGSEIRGLTVAPQR